MARAAGQPDLLWRRKVRLPSSSSGHERGRRGGAHNAGEAERGQGGAAPDEGLSKVFLSDRFHRTAGHRFRLTGPVGPVTGKNRLNSNLNSKPAVIPVSNG